MILVNGCSFTSGEESTVAWPKFIPNTINLATAGASNDHIVISTVNFIRTLRKPDYAIIQWTSPDRIEISGKHLTPTSGRRYGQELVDLVFADWNTDLARSKFKSQVALLHAYLEQQSIPHFFISAWNIQSWAQGTAPAPWLGWPDQGMVEWMGDCPRGPGGHPLELGHKRIAEQINEHIRNLGWIS